MLKNGVEIPFVYQNAGGGPTYVTKTMPRFAMRSKKVLISPCSSNIRRTSSLWVSYCVHYEIADQHHSENDIPCKGNPRRRVGSSFPNRGCFWVWIYLNVPNEQRSARAFTANSLLDERVVDFIISFSTHRTFWGLGITESSLRIARSLI